MKKAIKTMLLVATAGLAACSDNTVAPPDGSSDASEMVDGGGATAALTPGDTIRFSFTIDPTNQTVFNLGAGNAITFPAHSLCDPDKSSYGDSEWDQPCAQAHSRVTVRAMVWMDTKGHARIDFDRHLRFVPANNPDKWVVLTFSDFQASLDPFFNILYCPEATGRCYDESKTDLSLLTIRNPTTGKVTRRIKHFSGYNVAAGDGDESAAMMSLSVDTRSMLSVSAADLQLDDLQAVALAHPRLNAGEVAIMLNNIRFMRLHSGYILASG